MSASFRPSSESAEIIDIARMIRAMEVPYIRKALVNRHLEPSEENVAACFDPQIRQAREKYHSAVNEFDRFAQVMSEKHLGQDKKVDLNLRLDETGMDKRDFNYYAPVERDNMGFVSYAQTGDKQEAKHGVVLSEKIEDARKAADKADDAVKERLHLSFSPDSIIRQAAKYRAEDGEKLKSEGSLATQLPISQSHPKNLRGK